MIDYYQILELEFNCDKNQIKKQYYKLCLQYHPDKNNGDKEKFIAIQEAYETLYDDKKRKKYNITRFFENVEITDEEYQLFENYYYKIIHSNEFKLMKLLYDSIPNHIKKNIWEKIIKTKKKEIVQLQKTINILDLFHNEKINLIISKEDVLQKKLKVIHIISKNGVYYLYLRNFHKIILNNYDCFLTIRFYCKGKSI